MTGFWSFKGRRFIAVIGSREAPDEALEVIRTVSEGLCDRGIAITSGDADGCDSAGLEGAMRSANFPMVGARIYLPWSPMRYKDRPTRFADDKIFFDASKFENYAEAQALALKARGSFEGLGRGGIALQSRNPYQILLDDLKTPVASVVCWAKPVGKTGKVSGGTNTAVQVALHHTPAVPVINLATDEGMERALRFIERTKQWKDETSSKA